MANRNYTAGPSVLRLSSNAQPIQPGQAFEHDFSVDGPEGEHGPGREQALLDCGAIARADAPAAASEQTSAAATTGSDGGA